MFIHEETPNLGILLQKSMTPVLEQVEPLISQNCHQFAWKRFLPDQIGNFPKTLPNRFWSRIRQLLRLSFPGEVFVVIVACIKKGGSEAVQTHTPNIQNIETKHTWNPESQARPILFSCQKSQVPYSNKILWVYGLLGARIHRELILPHPKESGIFALPNLLHILVASQQPGHSWLCSSAVSSFFLLEDCLISALKPPLHEIPWDLPRTWR